MSCGATRLGSLTTGNFSHDQDPCGRGRSRLGLAGYAMAQDTPRRAAPLRWPRRCTITIIIITTIIITTITHASHAPAWLLRLRQLPRNKQTSNAAFEFARNLQLSRQDHCLESFFVSVLICEIQPCLEFGSGLGLLLPHPLARLDLDPRPLDQTNHRPPQRAHVLLRQLHAMEDVAQVSPHARLLGHRAEKAILLKLVLEEIRRTRAASRAAPAAIGRAGSSRAAARRRGRP